MFTPHPSHQLTEIFTLRPYQGAAPDQAKFLFIGLDANYDGKIEVMPIFIKIIEYHNDGVAFWKKYGVHHPFLLPGYNGDGKYYHKNFANIGFKPEHADDVSFIELLHVPTVGRNKLERADLNHFHLELINAAILEGSPEYIFISSCVARLMIQTNEFPWLKKAKTSEGCPLDIYYKQNTKTVYSHLHFSVYGKFEERKRLEAEFIGTLHRNN